MTEPSADAHPGSAAPDLDVTESPVTEPQGAARSFEALFRAEFAGMYRLAHLLGAADPEDVAQEAFARLQARWPGLADRGSAGGYLRTTVVNLVRSAARHRAVAQRHALRGGFGGGLGGGLGGRLGGAPNAEASAPSAESTALASVSDATMLAALGDLSPRHREALVLRFWLDASERQIAEVMGTSAGTAKSHVSRGLAALRAALADRGEL